ncbi:unnamed protein product [Rhizophagus irregularis]|nr:unnamed protein product [Rhizophagus irregularis]CAB5379115.1 unnamed protein product [Rhizophagus irregularis]
MQCYSRPVIIAGFGNSSRSWISFGVFEWTEFVLPVFDFGLEYQFFRLLTLISGSGIVDSGHIFFKGNVRAMASSVEYRAQFTALKALISFLDTFENFRFYWIWLLFEQILIAVCWN